MGEMGKKVKLGSQGLEVSAQGLECDGASPDFQRRPLSETSIIALIHHAVLNAVTFINTGRSCEIAVGKAIKGTRSGTVVLATVLRLSHVCIRDEIEASLARLQVDSIDLLYIDCSKPNPNPNPGVPIETIVGELGTLVEEGKVKYIGLSDPSASIIRKAHTVHPITAVQVEWSLWNRAAEEDVIPTCRELGIGIVARNPIGGDNLKLNKIEQRRRINQMAARKGCTASQLALSWIHHQGSDVVPIPGAAKIEQFDQNIRALFTP